MIDEGATSYKKTKYGILPRLKVLKLEVLGTKKGLIFLNERAKTDKRLTPNLVKQIHRISFAEILLDDAGKFRTTQVLYSGKEAPHFSKIAEMVKVLCEDTEFALSRL